MLLAAIGAAVDGGDSDTSDKGTSASASSAPKDKAEKAPAAKEPTAAEPAPAAPVKVTAKETAFTPSILADGSDYTSVKVTITNNSEPSPAAGPSHARR
ncbi:hypothetical protein [Streptomyces sp. NPDC000983]|uniref:hypothetical protein n=1 Tax=Streptomyces sp. NPDC000983 TaxID=3154373 RepID=UPI00332E9389